jgi:predicted dehydrogenase
VDEKTRFALIGAGGIAQSYAQAFEACPAAELVAVVDVRIEAARALAERFGCASYPTHQALVESAAQFDAVLICTPPNTHEEVSVFFIERGVHVLCEKPFSLNAASAQRMYEAAHRCGVLLTMCSKFRYVDDVIRAKSIVLSGILGEIILFENAFTSHVDMSKRWNAQPAVSGGGVLIDNGAHSVDLMRYFLGPLADVQVVEGKRVQGLQVEDTVRIFVRSVGGVMGSIDLSWSLNKELDSYLNIFGSRGTILVGWKESKYRQSSSRDWIVFGKGYDKVQALSSQLTNFARAVKGEEKLLITADDALASVDVIDAAYQALHGNHWTTVRPTTPANGRANRLAIALNGVNGHSAKQLVKQG